MTLLSALILSAFPRLIERACDGGVEAVGQVGRAGPTV
jgi:hypothetical protein